MIAGRPLKFKTPEDLLKKAEGYFKKTQEGEYTITGLAVFLDTSRETLMNYQHRDIFFDTVKKIKDKIEADYELSLRRHGRSGEIFGLKNFGWKDKMETDITTGGRPLTLSELPNEELSRIAYGSEEGTSQERIGEKKTN